MVAVSLKKNFFQAEDGIRDVERSRGLGDVYKRQTFNSGHDKSPKFDYPYLSDYIGFHDILVGICSKNSSYKFHTSTCKDIAP